MLRLQHSAKAEQLASVLFLQRARVGGIPLRHLLSDDPLPTRFIAVLLKS